MTPELAQRLLDKYDRNHSVIYPLIKDEIESYHYPDMDLPWPECFLFFEDDYLKYYLDIVERKIPCSTETWKREKTIGRSEGFCAPS